MSTDFLKPVVSDNYAALLPALSTTIKDLACGLDPANTGTKTNIPTNCLQWNSVASKWEKFNGTSWADMSSLYAINISGNAATATNATNAATAAATSGNSGTATGLIGDQSNWVNYRSSSVANMLGWRNYGNNHVIFDASNGLSPNGAAINNANSAQVWGATYPTLMGWNGSTTYGLRVDSARTSDITAQRNFTNLTITEAGVTCSLFLTANGWGTRRLYAENGLLGFLSHAGGWTLYSTNTGDLVATGNVTAYSDKRLKENVQTVDSALEKVCLLRGVYYNRIDDVLKKRKIGVIAQEIQEILPEVVLEGIGKDLYKSVDYGNIVGLLIEAIKELKLEVSALTAVSKG